MEAVEKTPGQDQRLRPGVLIIEIAGTPLPLGAVCQSANSLVAMPFFVPTSFLLLVVRPRAPGSVLVPSSFLLLSCREHSDCSCSSATEHSDGDSSVDVQVGLGPR